MLRKTLLLDCEKADVQLKELDQVQVMLQVEPKGVFHEVIILPASMTTENDGHSSFLEKFWSFTHCNLLGSSILSEWFAFRYNHELICLTAHSRNAALNEVDHWKLSVIIWSYQWSLESIRGVSLAFGNILSLGSCSSKVNSKETYSFRLQNFGRKRK